MQLLNLTLEFPRTWRDCRIPTSSREHHLRPPWHLNYENTISHSSFNTCWMLRTCPLIAIVEQSTRLVTKNPGFKSQLLCLLNLWPWQEPLYLSGTLSSPIKKTLLEWVTCRCWEDPEEEALIAVKPSTSIPLPLRVLSLHLKRPFPEATERGLTCVWLPLTHTGRFSSRTDTPWARLGGIPTHHPRAQLLSYSCAV